MFGIPRIRTILYGVAALALAFFVWQGVMFVDAKYEAEAQVERYEQQMEIQQDTIEKLRAEADQRQRAEDTADAVRQNLEDRDETYSQIRKEASEATTEDDGEIAPVLRRALDSLGGM